MVLTRSHLFTYKTEEKKKKTEKIFLQECVTIKSSDEELKLSNTFRIDSASRRFYFRTDDHSAKET